MTTCKTKPQDPYCQHSLILQLWRSLFKSLHTLVRPLSQAARCRPLAARAAIRRVWCATAGGRPFAGPARHPPLCFAGRSHRRSPWRGYSAECGQRAGRCSAHRRWWTRAAGQMAGHGGCAVQRWRCWSGRDGCCTCCRWRRLAGGMRQCDGDGVNDQHSMRSYLGQY